MIHDADTQKQFLSFEFKVLIYKSNPKKPVKIKVQVAVDLLTMCGKANTLCYFNITHKTKG
jgi:hypothetical protein